MEPITVLKRNPKGQVTWQYTGFILERGREFVRLEARFNRPDTLFMDVVLRQDDRFVELFYTDRWYSIFEIHDRDDDRTKGWYCNLGRPAVWDSADSISYVDLELDLWVSADGTQTVVDQAEFELLGLDDVTRACVMAALEELRELFRNKKQDGS